MRRKNACSRYGAAEGIFSLVARKFLHYCLRISRSLPQGVASSLYPPTWWKIFLGPLSDAPGSFWQTILPILRTVHHYSISVVARLRRTVALEPLREDAFFYVVAYFCAPPGSRWIIERLIDDLCSVVREKTIKYQTFQWAVGSTAHLTDKLRQMILSAEHLWFFGKCGRKSFTVSTIILRSLVVNKMK